MSDDAISRQEAIEAIDSWLKCKDYNEAERHIMRAAQSVLHDLPSVTPNPCEDAISRQAAIDAILTKYTEYERLKMLHFTPNIIKQECADLLTDLPYIQPIRPRGIG